LTTLHYADSLNTPRDNAFRLAYAKAYKLQPDVYAVQGYDAGADAGHRPGRGQGRRHEEGRVRRRGAQGPKIDSPRGAFTLSKSHNPVQDIYLRQVAARRTR
jgi:branched-chain amino acid transport system substrate-binding protein